MPHSRLEPVPSWNLSLAIQHGEPLQLVQLLAIDLAGAGCPYIEKGRSSMFQPRDVILAV